MAGELMRYLAATPAEREREAALERVHTAADVALARVSGIVRVGQAAELGMLAVSMTKRESALLVPEDAAKLDLIATHTAIALAGEVNRVAGR